MTTLAEVEDKFFQLLHPIMSSKGMAITGAILKGLLKGSLKIDLGDEKDQGTWNIQIPDIKLPQHLKDINKSILIFDDLERCNIELSSLLGYINYFVEHQELKVIIVANEDKLKDDQYQGVKEKLIGKIFSVFPDFEGALESFITTTDNVDARNFLSDNINLIKDLYDMAKYENLRSLKQVVLDFVRIFEALPEKAKKKTELLQDLLKFTMAFSIEIRRAEMLPKHISNLQEEYMSRLSKKVKPSRLSSYVTREETVAKEKIEELNPLQKMLSRYTTLDLHQPLPSAVWWQRFFDQGIVDEKELEQSVLSSRYFQDENTPNWIKLWHFSSLSDNEFDTLLKEVELEYEGRKHLELGIVKHIFGLFLMFSDAELYSKKKEEILKETKLYIDHLKANNKLDLSPPTVGDLFSGHAGLGFQSKDSSEFKELCFYINKVRELAMHESMPTAGQDLLTAMQSDSWKFYRMICRSDGQNRDPLVHQYYDVPILTYIKSHTFVERLLLLQSEDIRHVCWALRKRYEVESTNEKLIEELKWLKSVQSLLLKESEARRGKLSGFVIKLIIEQGLSEAIGRLEATKSKSQASS